MLTPELLDQIRTGDLPALQLAARAHPDVLRDRGPGSPDEGQLGPTALHEATRAGQLEVARWLISGGAELEARTGEGRTALHDAYEWGRDEVLQALLDAGAHEDVAVAAALGHFARVDELLAEDPGLVNDPSTGLSPLGWAGYGQDPAMVSFLLERGATLQDEICCPCGTGQLDILEAFLVAGADPNGLSPGWKARPLHVAASLPYQSDARPTAERLLQAGADVNGLAADERTTPLDVAEATATRRPERAEGARLLADFLRERGARRGTSELSP